MTSSYIDPEEFPFTQQEVQVALAQSVPEDRARALAEDLARQGPDLIEARAQYRETAKRGGHPTADEWLHHAWAYPPELLDALAALSSDARARVDALRARVLADRDRRYGRAES